jgi:tRNA (guanine37-N1)-methyltransferase
MKFDIITIFPGLFDGFLKESLISKAIHKRLISVRTHYLRKWTTDRHQTVDGKPYGGGPGLVMRVEPIAKAISTIVPKYRSTKSKKGTPVLRHSGTRIILFSPRGKQFDQAMAKRLAKYDQLVFICGRYEGVDERVADHIADEVVSVGPYVLNGGEVAAMAVIEAVARLIPGFMHDADSATKEDHASYTKPEVFSGWKVPKVLLSGNHAKIKAWRDKHRK